MQRERVAVPVQEDSHWQTIRSCAGSRRTGVDVPISAADCRTSALRTGDEAVRTVKPPGPLGLLGLGALSDAPKPAAFGASS